MPAAAQTTPAYSQHDVRCFIVASVIMGGAKDGDAKAMTAGMMAALYFAGKIYGANAEIDLLAALEAELIRMPKVDLAALRKECGEEMRVHGDEIQTAGKALQAKEQLGSSG
jgi:hypothetical protein